MSRLTQEAPVGAWQARVDEVAATAANRELIEFKRQLCVAGARFVIDEVGVEYQQTARRLSRPLSPHRVNEWTISNPVSVEDSSATRGHFDYVVGTRRSIEKFSPFSQGSVDHDVVFIRNQSAARGWKDAYHTNWEWVVAGLPYAAYPGEGIRREATEKPELYIDSLGQFAGLLDEIATSAGIVLPEPEALVAASR